jgi:hypothetical protein
LFSLFFLAFGFGLSGGGDGLLQNLWQPLRRDATQVFRSLKNLKKTTPAWQEIPLQIAWKIRREKSPTKKPPHSPD